MPIPMKRMRIIVVVRDKVVCCWQLYRKYTFKLYKWWEITSYLSHHRSKPIQCDQLAPSLIDVRFYFASMKSTLITYHVTKTNTLYSIFPCRMLGCKLRSPSRNTWRKPSWCQIWTNSGHQKLMFHWCIFVSMCHKNRKTKKDYLFGDKQSISSLNLLFATISKTLFFGSLGKTLFSSLNLLLRKKFPSRT